MLGNDRARMELAYSLQFTLHGTPVLRYGEEIGMGDDLALPERDAIRTPMQWFGGDNAGFSSADPSKLIRPLISGGDHGYEKVNVTAQRSDPSSLLGWFERMIRTLRECPEVGIGRCSLVTAELPAHVLAHRFDAPEGSMLFLHNLGERQVTVSLGRLPGTSEELHEVFSDRDYQPPTDELQDLKLGRYGYRWIRLNHNLVRRSTRAVGD